MTTAPLTNATAAGLALDLAEMGVRASFMSIVYRLAEKLRLAPGEKRGGLKLAFGDALVLDTFVSGFKYRSLKARDLAALNEWLVPGALEALVAEGLTGFTGRKKTDVARALTIEDYRAALWAAAESCLKSSEGRNSATHDHVFESLEVDGKHVRGARVYVGNPNGKDAAPVGTIYLSGLRVGRKYIDQPANGWGPASRSGVMAVAKGRLGKTLPSRRYVTYKLVPGGEWALNVGAGAVQAADAGGVTCDPVAVAAIRGALLAS
jgi:hypothetical protein